MTSNTNNPVPFDILEEDPPESLAYNQHFGVIALTRPMTDSDNNMKVAMKLKGCFAFEQQAQDKAKEISRMDDRYDVFVCPLGKWLMIPPDLAQINDQHHQDEMLTEIMQQHNKQEEVKRVKFDERKQQLMNQPDELNTQELMNSTDPVTQKLL